MMLGYLGLYEGEYEVAEMLPDEEHLIVKLALPFALPGAFSSGTEDFYITGENSEVRLIIKSHNGRFKRYYRNYKDYDYLPAEDTAIPKVLSACMDKKLRKAAKKETCYTWFACTEAFLGDKRAQMAYLSDTLPFLLGTLK